MQKAFPSTVAGVEWPYPKGITNQRINYQKSFCQYKISCLNASRRRNAFLTLLGFWVKKKDYLTKFMIELT